jgi:hypothetical protein
MVNITNNFHDEWHNLNNRQKKHETLDPVTRGKSIGVKAKACIELFCVLSCEIQFSGEIIIDC